MPRLKSLPSPSALTSRAVILAAVLCALMCSTVSAKSWDYQVQHGAWLKACSGDMRINLDYKLAM
ncbi:hypothetical protein HDU93_001409, partial [Gonapodya sp. JEL0774]